jgi:hypothetical protein
MIRDSLGCAAAARWRVYRHGIQAMIQKEAMRQRGKWGSTSWRIISMCAARSLSAGM